MIALVMLVCLADKPTHCHTENLNFDGDKYTSQQCFIYGQMGMAKWVADHPNYIIMNWHCEVAGESAKL